MQTNETAPSCERDPLFKMMLDIQTEAEKHEPEAALFPLTLNVGGILISGKLITAKQYFAKFQIQFLRDAIKKVNEMPESELEKFKGETEPESLGPSVDCVHLRDARFFAPGQRPIPQNRADMLWRGKLSSVDGFIVGELQAEIS